MTAPMRIEEWNPEAIYVARAGMLMQIQCPMTWGGRKMTIIRSGHRYLGDARWNAYVGASRCYGTDGRCCDSWSRRSDMYPDGFDIVRVIEP